MKREKKNKSNSGSPRRKVKNFSLEDDVPSTKKVQKPSQKHEVEEILVNPNINNTLGGADGIYSLISSKFQQQYTPMNHTMKIKFTNIWYVINDINIYNFCVSGNLSSGQDVTISAAMRTGFAIKPFADPGWQDLPVI